MIRRTSPLLYREKEKIKVAILGSGLTGCTVASTLLSSPEGEFDIALYEAGRNVGGRMSARRYIDTETGLHASQFDHGCQVINPPRTEEFRDEFDRWKERGWVKPWEGRFGEISCPDDADTDVDDDDDDAADSDDGPSDRHRFVYDKLDRKTVYVGHPRMSSICENLLRTPSSKSTIDVITKTHATASHKPVFAEDPKFMWKIETNNNFGARILGDYDWLVVTDRASFKPMRYDLTNANVEKLAHQVNKRMESVPSMVTMVKFHEPLGLDVDGLQLDYYSNPRAMREAFGSLGWIARDSSKPGRRRFVDEGDSGSRAECWLLQANRRETARLLGRRDLAGASMEKIQSAIRQTMVDDFRKAIPKIASMTNDDRERNDDSRRRRRPEKFEIPPMVQSTSHRWGSAFPEHMLSRKAKKNAFLDARRGKECVVEAKRQFIACGDYFGEHHGTVEGAFLSGRAAGEHLIQEAIRWGYD